MLTKKQNLLETIHGGKPDRYVNQYEYMHVLLSDPFNLYDPYPEYGQLNVTNGWGITLSWPEGTPGPFPVHDDAHKLLGRDRYEQINRLQSKKQKKWTKKISLWHL